MYRLFIAICLAVAFAWGNTAAAQDLYVSKQTGQFTIYQGSHSKTTDMYESGNVAITTVGPIKWDVQPMQLNIGPNQTVTWNGKIWPDVANAPAPGTSVDCKVKGNYDVNFSRPAGTGGGGNVTGTYNCGGCPAAHANNPNGVHELVNKVDVYEIPLRVYSLKAEIVGNPQCSNGSVQLVANVFPSGNVTWTTPFGTFSGASVTAPVPPGFAGGNVTVTLEVNGVTYSDTKVMPGNDGTLKTFAATQLCIGAPTTAPAVTQATFSNGGCPANNLIYVPMNIGPSPTAAFTNIPLSLTSGNTTLNTSIQAINKNITTTNSFQVNFSADPIENILNVISGQRCSSGGSLIPNGQFSYTTFQECCVTSVKNQQKYEGQMNWSYGINCRFPFYGIPYVATADFLCGASLNASIAVNGTTQCTGAPQICTDIACNGSLSGGLGVSLAAGFVTADLQVVLEGLGFTGSYCFYPPPRAGKIQGTLGKIKVVGSVTGGWGLATYSVEHVLFEGISTPEFTF